MYSNGLLFCALLAEGNFYRAKSEHNPNITKHLCSEPSTDIGCMKLGSHCDTVVKIWLFLLRWGSLLSCSFLVRTISPRSEAGWMAQRRQDDGTAHDGTQQVRAQEPYRTHSQVPIRVSLRIFTLLSHLARHCYSQCVRASCITVCPRRCEVAGPPASWPAAGLRIRSVSSGLDLGISDSSSGRRESALTSHGAAMALGGFC